MGVPGLWETINKVGKSTSLLHLAVTRGFENNDSRRRGYRLGIDASIWFHHALGSKGGENPELRNLFFRLIFLAKQPIIPLFMFDGRKRPRTKRGSNLGKSGSHPLVKDFKKLIEAFGMDWMEAPGEAEAELAHLNKQGYIDAVMTDDCDAFIFGAQVVLKNLSSNLSGNKSNPATNCEDKTDKLHTMLYRASDIATDSEVQLSRGGLILFALLSGGDYRKGVERIGKKIAHGLARCKFGDELLENYENMRTRRPEFNGFLQHWRARVNRELKENTKGFLPSRQSLTIPDNFPDLEVLEQYAFPLTSGSGRQNTTTNSLALHEKNHLSLAEIAGLCEKYFEWGYRDKIIERFRNLLWPCAVIRVLRHVALEADQQLQNAGHGRRNDMVIPLSLLKKFLKPKDKRLDIAAAFVNRGTAQTSSQYNDDDQIVLKIKRKRQHSSTDQLEEFYVEVSPVELVKLANSGIKGTRQEPDVRKQTKKAPPGANDMLSLWIPGSVLRVVYPSLVDEFEKEGRSHSRKGKGKAKAVNHEDITMDNEITENANTPARILQTRDNNRQPFDKTGSLEYEYETELDPWFIPSACWEVPFQRNVGRGFLFTFPNPNPDDKYTEDFVDDAVEVMCHSSEAIASTDVAMTHAERLADHILLKGGSASRKRKLSENSFALTHGGPTKRQMKTSNSQVLDALETLIL
ncbi:hypothetical protein D9613_000579 [Agrocybe pediades]|uniref:PIN domain-like protein n=1 Tax=Agrocybe pediades TaxID=84607 RepID=A0A8H4R0Q7_9AGAR|nr:hypothetical protein D9613_000579 [Agrocybe pediades]